MTSHIDLDAITLHEGSHDNLEDGHCLLEVVSLFAHEEFSDHPACVSPVLAAFGRRWNDGMRSDAERDQLRQYVPLLPGTAGHPDIDEAAAWMAFDWFVRTYTPTWLRLAGLTAQAERLEALPELQASTDVQKILQLLREVRDAAGYAADAAQDDARDSAETAARAAADDTPPTAGGLANGVHTVMTAMTAAVFAAVAAAGYAAVFAAVAAAGYAAVFAAVAAARDAAVAAAVAAAWNDARAARAAAVAAAGFAAVAAAWNDARAARDAAVAAAVAAAWNDAKAARAAAMTAAGDALQPTVDQLQTSAHHLYQRMIALYPRTTTVAAESTS